MRCKNKSSVINLIYSGQQLFSYISLGKTINAIGSMVKIFISLTPGNWSSSISSATIDPRWQAAKLADPTCPAMGMLETRAKYLQLNVPGTDFKAFSFTLAQSSALFKADLWMTSISFWCQGCIEIFCSGLSIKTNKLKFLSSQPSQPQKAQCLSIQRIVYIQGNMYSLPS